MRTVSSVIEGFSGCAGSLESDSNTESSRILKSDIEKKNLLSVFVSVCPSVFFFLPLCICYSFGFCILNLFLYQCHIVRLN